MRRRERERQEKRKKGQAILKKLRAVLQSSRGQHGKKMVYVREVPSNWDPRKGQQPFQPNPYGVGDRTTTLKRLLIGAGRSPSLLIVSRHLHVYWTLILRG